EEGRRCGEAERLRRLKVDEQLELGRYLHRKIGRLDTEPEASPCVGKMVMATVLGLSALWQVPARRALAGRGAYAIRALGDSLMSPHEPRQRTRADNRWLRGLCIAASLPGRNPQQALEN